MTKELSRKQLLIVRAASRLCGVPVDGVVEVMRPLPLQELAGLPPFLCGLAVIRGAPVPVVDVAALLIGVSGARIGRFISMRTEGRPFALGVEAVLGFRYLDEGSLHALPEIQQAARDLVDCVGALGTELITVLKASRSFGEALWAGIDRAQPRPTP